MSCWELTYSAPLISSEEIMVCHLPPLPTIKEILAKLIRSPCTALKHLNKQIYHCKLPHRIRVSFANWRCEIFLCPLWIPVTSYYPPALFIISPSTSGARRKRKGDNISPCLPLEHPKCPIGNSFTKTEKVAILKLFIIRLLHFTLNPHLLRT